MIEQRLQRQLRRAMILAFCFIIVFFICGGLFSAYLHRTRNEAIRKQVIAEAEEYKKRILKQLKADFQILSMLSVFIEEDYDKDKEFLAQQLDKVNQNNEFLTIVYYDRNGEGIISNLGNEPIVGASLSELSPEGRKGVELALEGSASVSRLFESAISENRVFSYSVPVYSKGEVVGALSASDQIEIFSEILSGDTVLGGAGYIHLIGSEGNFLVQSPKMIVKDDVPSIFDGPYLSDTSKGEVREALQQQKRIFDAFDYEGKSYSFLLEPIGINGWYLFCVNTGDGLVASSEISAFIAQITFIAVFLLMICLMLYGYRLLRNYNRVLIRMAYYDSLTGAENLSRFQQRLREALKNTGGSVVAVNIRQFPFINKIFGKEKANQLLREIKTAAEHCLNKEEFFCRDTEDRFYLFFKETEPEVLSVRLKAFIDGICKNSEISRTNYHLALYCGVATADESDVSDRTANNLMTHVQFALERAKGAHDSFVWFFDAELHKKEELENYIESHMHQALRDGEFKLFLQPKKNLRNGMLDGAEALVRWNTDEGKQIFPDQFIPLFERNGFCVKLDIYMVEQACRQIRSWLDRGIPPIPISVNQSKLLFFEENYVSILTDLLKKYDIPAKFITLEILEGLALENVEELNEKIGRLQDEGFRISLDDFGSGFSSLNTLGKLKIDELKLDREFLMSASEQEHGRVRLIMEQIVRMAGTLGISTVAEGVETTEDEQFIRAIGCDVGQGYLYSRPICASDFDEKYMKDAGRYLDHSGVK